MLEIILNNYEWIFSGIGVFALTVVVALFKRRSPSQSMVVGDASMADDVLNEIEQGYQPGNATLGNEARKVSLAAVPSAA